MKRNKLQQGRSISAGGHESRLDEFSHLDGFFCFTVLVSSENCFMFGINARLDGGFLAVLVEKWKCRF